MAVLSLVVKGLGEQIVTKDGVIISTIESYKSLGFPFRFPTICCSVRYFWKNLFPFFFHFRTLTHVCSFCFEKPFDAILFLIFACLIGQAQKRSRDNFLWFSCLSSYPTLFLFRIFKNLLTPFCTQFHREQEEEEKKDHVVICLFRMKKKFEWKTAFHADAIAATRLAVHVLSFCCCCCCWYWCRRLFTIFFIYVLCVVRRAAALFQDMKVSHLSLIKAQLLLPPPHLICTLSFFVVLREFSNGVRVTRRWKKKNKQSN